MSEAIIGAGLCGGIVLLLILWVAPTLLAMWRNKHRLATDNHRSHPLWDRTFDHDPRLLGAWTLTDRVIAFVSEQLNVRADAISLTTTIFGDLDTDGDDGVELLEAFGRAFGVDMSNCDTNRYFGPEGFPPWAPINWIILALRKGTPEERAGLKPITVADLIRSAELGYWADGLPPPDSRLRWM